MMVRICDGYGVGISGLGGNGGVINMGSYCGKEGMGLGCGRG